MGCGRWALAALIALVTWGGIEAYGIDIEASRRWSSHFKTAEHAQVPDIVRQLSGYRRWADLPYSDLLSSTEERRSPEISTPALPFCRSMPPRSITSSTACSTPLPTELPVIRDALRTAPEPP